MNVCIGACVCVLVCVCACVCVCLCVCGWVKKIGLFGNRSLNSRLTKSRQIESFITFSVN